MPYIPIKIAPYENKQDASILSSQRGNSIDRKLGCPEEITFSVGIKVYQC
jgi:hypothetical protein